MRGLTLIYIFFTRIYIFSHFYICIFTYEIQCFSFIFLFFSYLFIYLYIYLFRAANFMHNINIIHWSFFPTALPHRLPFLFLALPFFALACFLALPNSLPCLFPWPAHAYALFLCLFPLPSACFLSLPTSVPCLFPCPAYFRVLPIGLLFFMSAFCTGTFS